LTGNPRDVGCAEVRCGSLWLLDSVVVGIVGLPDFLGSLLPSHPATTIMEAVIAWRAVGVLMESRSVIVVKDARQLETAVRGRLEVPAVRRQIALHVQAAGILRSMTAHRSVRKGKSPLRRMDTLRTFPCQFGDGLQFFDRNRVGPAVIQIVRHVGELGNSVLTIAEAVTLAVRRLDKPD